VKALTEEVLKVEYVALVILILALGGLGLLYGRGDGRIGA